MTKRLPSGRRPWQAAVVLLTLAVGAGAQTPTADSRSAGADEAGFANLARELAAASPGRLASIQRDLTAITRSESRTLARQGPPWPPAALAGLAARLLVDPERFASDTRFQERALPVLEAGVDPAVPRELRHALLYSVQQLHPLPFDTAERIESAWGLLARPSRQRELFYRGEEQLTVYSGLGPIRASVYSLTSEFFDPTEVEAFLRAVHAATPERMLLVLTDLPLHARLGPLAREIGARFIEVYGRPYSPWPRDPLTFMRRADGGGLLLLRPNRQSLREEDSLMGRELIKALPAELDRALGGLAWSTSPLPFHNGHILLTPGTTWVSIHTFEARILELMEIDRVPVESFATADGIDDYLAAARRAASEMERLYGQPVRFVHPLPDDGPRSLRTATMTRLGGGAGFDLDTLITLVPTAGGGPPAALVADLDAGSLLMRRVDEEELARFAGGFDLQPGPAGLRRQVDRAHRSPRGRRLQSFLDLMAGHLESEGLTVSRLPLLLIPLELLPDRTDIRSPDFLVGWNNVVLEERDGGRRAEGFASLLPTGDAMAREAFDRLGYDLDLFPPLVESVRLNGGYRCASSHLPELEAAPQSASDDRPAAAENAGPPRSASEP